MKSHSIRLSSTARGVVDPSTKIIPQTHQSRRRRVTTSLEKAKGAMTAGKKVLSLVQR
ncbi:hypothetical protein GW17_00028921, partial [Ensete ventricosum]